MAIEYFYVQDTKCFKPVVGMYVRPTVELINSERYGDKPSMFELGKLYRIDDVSNTASHWGDKFYSFNFDMEHKPGWYPWCRNWEPVEIPLLPEELFEL